MLLQAMDMHGGTVGVREAHGQGRPSWKPEGVSWQECREQRGAGASTPAEGGQEEAWEATWARGPSS